MALRLRKPLVTVPVVSSVGWLGSAAVYAVLSVFALVDDDGRWLGRRSWPWSPSCFSPSCRWDRRRC
jgi:hypothetical protein